MRLKEISDIKYPQLGVTCLEWRIKRNRTRNMKWKLGDIGVYRD